MLWKICTDHIGQSADYKCPDACCCGRSVPTISAKKADKGDHCKGERTGTAGDTSDAAKDTKAFGRRGAKIYFCRKRSTYSGRGHCRCIQKPLEEEAQKYISAEKEVHTVEEAIAGAKDILAETVSDEADYRSFIRNLTVKEGKMTSSAKDDSVQSVYEMYYSFEEPVSRLAGHRILALNRGEKEKILNVKIEAPEEKILRYLEKKIIVSENPYTSEYLKEVAEDSYKRLIAPAIEREIRSGILRRKSLFPKIHIRQNI